MTSIARFILATHANQAIKEQFLRGATAGFVTKGLTAGVGFVCQVLLARMMGSVDYGSLVYILSWVSVLTILPKCGLDVALMRYVAEYSAKSEWGKLKAIVAFSVWTPLLTGLVVSAIAAVVAYSLKERLGYTLWLGFLLAFATLPLLAANSLRVAALYGLKRVFLAEFPDGMLRPFLLTASVAVLWAVGAISTFDVLATNLVVIILVFGVGTYWLVKSLSGEIRQAMPEYRIDEWVRTSLPLMGIAGMQVAMSQTDVLMIGTMLTAEQAGIYFAAARLSDLVVLGLAAVNSIMAPLISQLYHTGRLQELQQILTLSTRSGLAVTVLAVLFLVILGKKVLWLFGSQFIIAYEPMLILVAGQIVNASCGSVGFLMTMTGNERLAALVIGGAMLVSLALNFLLIPSLGIVGAALATATGIIFWNVVLLVETRRRLGVDASIMASV